MVSAREQKNIDRLAAVLKDGNVTKKPTQKMGMSHLMDFTGELKEARQQLAEAQSVAEKFKGAILTVKLKPGSITPSEFANRAEENYSHEEFLLLKEQIHLTQGNEQPIKIRPIGEGRYEIVYGHRRHRACLELGVDVLAIIEEMTDLQLWLSMTRENEDRKDLSPYEKALHFNRAIEKGIYRNWSEIAGDLGVTKQSVLRYKSFLDIPDFIINVIDDPLTLHTGHLAKFTKVTAEQKEKIKAINRKIPIDELLSILVQTKSSPEVNFEFGNIKVTGRTAKITVDIKKFGDGNMDSLIEHLRSYEKTTHVV